MSFKYINTNSANVLPTSDEIIDSHLAIYILQGKDGLFPCLYDVQQCRSSVSWVASVQCADPAQLLTMAREEQQQFVDDL